MSRRGAARESNENSIISGGLPPKPSAEQNRFRKRKAYIDDKGEKGEGSMISTYPLLRRILQSRKLLSDSINLKGYPSGYEGFPVEVQNPSLKYELLEYLVQEDNEAQAITDGRDRGGRGRLIHDSEKAFNEMSMVVLSKTDAPPSAYEQHTSVLTNSIHYGQPVDEWTRLKHLSIKSLGQKRTSFKTCKLHSEELVMYDRLHKQLLCCRCLAVKQLRPDTDITEIVMSDDYCLQWSIKWRELSTRVSQLKELLTTRASINGLLYSQIQNFLIREALQARFKRHESTAPLLITEFAQRIYEAEQLILDYESIGAADDVHQMELGYHLFMEDMRRLNEMIRNTDLLRENHMVETLGRILLAQIDEAEKITQPSTDDKGRNLQKKSLSAMGTLNESPNPEECDECDINKTSPTRSKILAREQKTPKSSVKPSALKQPSTEQKPHHRSTHSAVSFSKLSKEETESFWENSKDKKKQKSTASQMVDFLHSLSSLRIQLQQACALSETLKQAAVDAEYDGNAMKALELMSETHTQVLKIRGLEQRIEEVKRAIVKKQAEKQETQLENMSRNQSKMTPQSRTSMKRSGSLTRPFKYLKGVI